MTPDRTGPTVVAVVVTYHPVVEATRHLLDAVRPQVAHIVVVDNGSPVPTLEALRAVADATASSLVELGANLGIAAAQNVGVDHAELLGATHVLLLDQDSVPAPDMVERLLTAILDGSPDASGRRVAAVGAVAKDDRDGEPAFVYRATRWGPRRTELPTEPGTLVEAGFLIASGCLVDLAALRAVGPMAESYFIDHVDLEWGVRARNAGYTLYAVVGAELQHELGDTPQYVPGRERSVHVQSIPRNYYMVRNTVALVRSSALPAGWRVGYVWWITKYIVFYTIAVAPRRRRVPLMLRGLADGIRGRTGKMPEHSR
ncbi:glycosyltransferase family 2 protein [Cellulomonas sp. ICMP 17802]|uniref:glycosyltransferase family 2 protein n=1 Tax=Cellulomonas sp. ICMP 17802 TaxID=3239199 RepID=UPI00351ACEFB